MDSLLLKRTVFASAEACGLNALSRRLHAKSLAVLCYHGVVEGTRTVHRQIHVNTVGAQEFSSHLDYIAKWFTPITAADLISSLTDGKRLPANPVLITFDDGYRNNLTQAAPLLLRKGIPAVIHLSTDYIDSRRILWPQEIFLRVVDWPDPELRTAVGVFALPGKAGSPERYPVARTVSQACKRIAPPARDEFLSLLREKTPPSPSHYDAEAHDFMTWAEARRLAEQGFELGSHTESHPILSGLPVECVTSELSRSRTIIEGKTGAPCTVLAYPNGSREDFSPAVIQETEKAGYSVAFSVEDRRAGEQPPRFAVPRLGVAGHVPLPLFYSKLSGLYALLGRSR
jgi:peptidoglycan/xylan/chitin deacetylase (PgdA/CDA1 family)